MRQLSLALVIQKNQYNFQNLPSDWSNSNLDWTFEQRSQWKTLLFYKAAFQLTRIFIYVKPQRTVILEKNNLEEQ